MSSQEIAEFSISTGLVTTIAGYTQNRTTSGPFSASTSSNSNGTTSSTVKASTPTTPTTTTPIPVVKSTTTTTTTITKPFIAPPKKEKKLHPHVKIDSEGNKSIGTNLNLPSPEPLLSFKVINILTPQNEEETHCDADQVIFGGQSIRFIHDYHQGEHRLGMESWSCFGLSSIKVSIERWNNGKIGSNVKIRIARPARNANKVLIDESQGEETLLILIDTKVESGFTFEKLDKLQGRLRQWGVDHGYPATASIERALPVPLIQPPIHPTILDVPEEEIEYIEATITSIGAPIPDSYDRLNPKTWVPPLPIALSKSGKKAKEAAARKLAGGAVGGGGVKELNGSGGGGGEKTKKLGGGSGGVGVAGGKRMSAVVGSSAAAAAAATAGGDVDWNGDSSDSKGVKGSAKKGKGKATKPRVSKAAAVKDTGDDEFRENSRKGGRIRKAVVLQDALGSDYDTMDEDDYSDVPPPKKSRASISSSKLATKSTTASKSPVPKGEDDEEYVNVEEDQDEEEIIETSTKVIGTSSGSNKREVEVDENESSEGTEKKRKDNEGQSFTVQVTSRK